MIYTVGEKIHMEAAFLQEQIDNVPFLKIGRTSKYQGGIVFETVSDASQFLLHQGKINNYGVYGVEAEWGDCIPQLHKPFRRLQFAAQIVRVPV